MNKLSDMSSVVTEKEIQNDLTHKRLVLEALFSVFLIELEKLRKQGENIVSMEK